LTLTTRLLHTVAPSRFSYGYDPYLDFIKDFYVLTTDTGDILPKKEVHEDFVEWCTRTDRKQLLQRKYKGLKFLKGSMKDYGFDLNENEENGKDIRRRINGADAVAIYGKIRKKPIL